MRTCVMRLSVYHTFSQTARSRLRPDRHASIPRAVRTRAGILLSSLLEKEYQRNDKE